MNDTKQQARAAAVADTDPAEVQAEVRERLNLRRLWREVRTVAAGVAELNRREAAAEVREELALRLTR